MGDRRALLHLLAGASSDAQTRVDALVALSSSAVFIPCWNTRAQVFRYATSPEGNSALPLFTDETTAINACHMFGWDPQAVVEVGFRKAYRHVAARELPLIIVDFGTEHMLEVTPDELKPLLRQRSESTSSGAFAAVGRISQVMMAEWEKGRKLGTLPAPESEQVSSNDANPASRVLSPTPDEIESAPEMEDVFFSDVSTVLREFPEVEWATLVQIGEHPAVGIRIDELVSKRREEILLAAAAVHESIGAFALHDPDVAHRSRVRGTLFYPWRNNMPRS